VDVLLWLVPTGVATSLAMVWAAWAGRRQRAETGDMRRRSTSDDEAARARIGLALSKPLPARAAHRTHQTVPHATGVAIRRHARQPPAPVGVQAQPGDKLGR